MPIFTLSDPDTILELGQAHTELNLARALLLLAIATAPAPDSRYQPGTSWTVVKYGTAIDPRARMNQQRRAAATPGIWDLDPHQKTVLADDLGVALALACIDQHFGIIGLADCYSLWLQDLLQLRNDGRHRKMPDFVVLLEKPLKDSPLILLECKGSTRQRASQSQLTSACRQLNNVSQIDGLGSAAHDVPRVGIATTVHPGAPVTLAVSDPPEPIKVSAELARKLRANYVALELAAFRDLSTSEKVRKAAELPTWASLRIPATVLDKPPELEIQQIAFASLPRRKKLSAFEKEVLDTDLAKRECVARVELRGSPSEPAKFARVEPAASFSEHIGISKGSTSQEGDSESISELQNQRRVVSKATTRFGIRAELHVDVW
jgi:hypothetical protein